MSTTEEIRRAALSLPDDDRAALVQDLIDSLPDALSEQEWSAAWADELHARYDEYLRGEVTPIDGEESLKELEAELQRIRRS
jgi:putative addiction module component (TIGR02574 family)